MKTSLLVRADALAHQPVIALEHGGQVFRALQVAAVDAFREGIYEHRGSGGFQIVPLASALIDHLPPQAARWVLMADNSIGEPFQYPFH